MVYHFGHQIFRQAAVQDDGIPMLFIHVVARNDGCVLGTQGPRIVGIAFEIHAQGFSVLGDEGKHLAKHFEYQCAFTKRVAGGGRFLCQAIDF